MSLHRPGEPAGRSSRRGRRSSSRPRSSSAAGDGAGRGRRGLLAASGQARRREEQGVNALAIHLGSIAFPPGTPRGPHGLEAPNVRCYPRALGEANRRRVQSGLRGGGFMARAVRSAGGSFLAGLALGAAGGRRVGEPRPQAPARPAHRARAAARAAGPRWWCSCPGMLGSQLLRPRRQRRLAEPRQHARAPRPRRCRASCRSPTARDDLAPGFLIGTDTVAAARLRLHRVRRPARPPRRRGLRAGRRTRPALRGLHLRLAARPRGEPPAASRCGSRASRARRATPARASTSSATAWAACVVR